MSNPANDELTYQLALNLIPKIGPAIYRNVLAYAGSAQNFFELPAGRISKIPRINKTLVNLRNDKERYLEEAKHIIQVCRKKDIKIISFTDPAFPTRLKGLDDCPMILYVKGNLDLNHPRTVGIVGTRNATEYGKNITRKIIEDLTAYAPQVISGLAYGVDIEAHRSALSNSLPTIGILGSSVDKIYPSAHKNTVLTMLDAGGLVSEYPPGTEMHPSNFPRRNRIIAGLSDALIVVEAAERGGALITAEIAYSYNKEVFAVPGNLQSPFSEGCNNLIRGMKASIFTGAKDLEESLSWSKENPTSPSSINAKPDFNAYSREEKMILELLDEKKEMEVDLLSSATGLSIATLASKLLNLEFEGHIKSLPGKKYRANF